MFVSLSNKYQPQDTGGNYAAIITLSGFSVTRKEGVNERKRERDRELIDFKVFFAEVFCLLEIFFRLFCVKNVCVHSVNL